MSLSHWETFRLKIRQAARVLELEELDRYKVDFIDERGFFEFMHDMENSSIYKNMALKRRSGNGHYPAFIDMIGYFSEASASFFEFYTSLMKGDRLQIRIISHRLNPGGENRDMSSLLYLRRLQEMNIKIRAPAKGARRVHSRLLVYYLKEDEKILPFEGRLVMGSFDFNKEGLGRGERRDAGIRTQNPDLVESAVEHFNSIWNNLHYTQTLDDRYPPPRAQP